MRDAYCNLLGSLGRASAIRRALFGSCVLGLVACGGAPPIAEIPPLDTEEVLPPPVDSGPPEQTGPWRPTEGGERVRLGMRTLAEGEALDLEGGPCEEVVVYVAQGRLQDGGAVREAGTLIRTQDMIALSALRTSQVVVSLNAPADGECAIGDDQTHQLGEPLQAAGGKLRVQILLDAASGGLFGSFAILDADADLSVPVHVHPDSAEVLLITGGDGTMLMGGERIPLQVGATYYIPAGVEHGYEAGTEPLRAFQVYAGPGPEQRFRAAATE